MKKIEYIFIILKKHIIFKIYNYYIIIIYNAAKINLEKN